MQASTLDTTHIPLPKTVISAIPFIEDRVSRAIEPHVIYDIGDKPRKNAEFVLPIVQTHTVLSIASVITHRMLVKGTLRFEGVPATERHIYNMMQSVTKRLFDAHENEFMFREKIRSMIILFLYCFVEKQHAVVLGHDVRRQNTRPSLYSFPTHTSLH